MKLLLTGAQGQVAQSIVQQNTSFDILALTRQELDITNHQQVFKTIQRTRPDIVINAAAYTAVDLAEKEQDLAYQINRDGADIIAKACALYHVPMIHLSTDYVFDGKKTAPYDEHDAASPLSTYGKSKYEGELRIRQALPEHLIFRTSWVFSTQGTNFVKTMLKLGETKTHLRIIHDQFGCPTSADEIATMLLHVAQDILSNKRSVWGTYHYCQPEPTNWYQFADKIFFEWERLTGKKPPTLDPITTSEYSTAAARPQHAVLDCHKFDKTFNIARQPWSESLVQTLKELNTYEV